jgi:hypothetical protein
VLSAGFPFRQVLDEVKPVSGRSCAKLNILTCDRMMRFVSAATPCRRRLIAASSTVELTAGSGPRAI